MDVGAGQANRGSCQRKAEMSPVNAKQKCPLSCKAEMSPCSRVPDRPPSSDGVVHALSTAPSLAEPEWWAKGGQPRPTPSRRSLAEPAPNAHAASRAEGLNPRWNSSPVPSGSAAASGVAAAGRREAGEAVPQELGGVGQRHRPISAEALRPAVRRHRPSLASIIRMPTAASRGLRVSRIMLRTTADPSRPETRRTRRSRSSCPRGVGALRSVA